MVEKRIFQVVQHLRPGGIETMALDLMDRAMEGRNVHVISLEGTADDAIAAWPRLAEYGDKLHFIGKKPGFDLPAIWTIAEVFRHVQPDAIHTHHIGPLIYGGLAARLAGVPNIVHTEHDAWHLGERRRRILQSLAYKLVRPIFIADAHLVAKAVKAALPSIVVQTIHNGVDTEKFVPGDKIAARRHFGLPETAIIIGCAARLEPVKRHADLISALELLPDNVHLALAGDGSLRKDLEAEAISRKLGDRVHFLGNVNEMAVFHQAQDVFCLASEKEGLPLSPLEAQASGCPVVLTDVGGCREALCPDTGLLAPARSPGQLAERIARAITSKSPATPRRFVENQRSLKSTIAAYDALYTQNLSGAFQ